MLHDSILVDGALTKPNGVLFVSENIFNFVVLLDK